MKGERYPNGNHDLVEVNLWAMLLNMLVQLAESSIWKQTGAITGQYHVVYDELFTTVANNGVGISEWTEGIWSYLFDNGIENRFDPADQDKDGNHAFQDFYNDFLKSRGRSSDSEVMSWG